MFTLVNQIEYYTDILKKLLADDFKPDWEKWVQVGIAISKIQQLNAELLQHCLLHTRDKYNSGMPGIGSTITDKI